MYKDVMYREVNVLDLEQYFEKLYGFNPEIIAGEEWSNDESHRADITGTLASWELEAIDELMKTKQSTYGTCQSVLQKMVIDKYLEPALYLVVVYW